MIGKTERACCDLDAGAGESKKEEASGAEEKGKEKRVMEPDMS